jgi:hypothetical protein
MPQTSQSTALWHEIDTKRNGWADSDVGAETVIV